MADVRLPPPTVGGHKCTELTDAMPVAEYCIIRTEATVKIPTDVDPASSAPLLCAGVTVFNSMRQMKITSGEIVAVQGLGGLGHLALQYANKMGFKVVALSSTGAKEKFAKDLGAHYYIDGSKENHAEALTKMGGAAMIVSTAPNPDVMGDLVNGLAPAGKLVILARTSECLLITSFSSLRANMSDQLSAKSKSIHSLWSARAVPYMAGRRAMHSTAKRPSILLSCMTSTA